jgi:hypothetical protein
VGEIVDTEVDADAETVTITISIEKANWTYIEITDQYPDNPDLIVKTADGRTISSDMYWRENGKVYVLDDPATEYLFIYSYGEEGFLFDVLLELTPDSVHVGEDITALITLINVGELGTVNGTVNYTLHKGDDDVIWSAEENVSVLGQKAYNKTILTDELSPGSYTYEVVYSYGDDQTASSSKTFIINAVPQPPAGGIPLWIIIVIVVILIIILIVAILFKTGYFYLEKTDKKKEK